MANLYLVKLSPALFSHRYLNKLPIKSQALIKGYKSKQAKIQKIGSSLLIAHVLRKYKISESLLRIDKNGKPYVIGNEIHFNVSHSYNVLVCVTSNSVIGVDVEMTNPRLKMIKSMFLSTNEQKEYLHSSDSQLTQIWACKEAIVKMTGVGLSKRLHTINNKNIACTHIIKYGNAWIAIASKNKIIKPKIQVIKLNGLLN